MVADGSNADDRGDYRPGRQAAREFGIRSPLDEAGLTKRRFASCHIVPVFAWDEPASACLSSRIPYHSEVTRELRAIESAEDVLRSLDFRVPGPSPRTRIAGWVAGDAGATRNRERGTPARARS